MKNNKPELTHTEMVAYAIQYVYAQYKDIEAKAAAVEKSGDKESADIIRAAFPWEGKLKALCLLYKMETGAIHEFDPAAEE